MKNITMVVMYLVVGGNILNNSWEYNELNPIEYARAEEPEVVEPEVVLIEAVVEWTEERIMEEIRNTFPEEPEKMIQVAWCESRLKPDAKGPTQDYGIFQLHDPSHDLSGIDVFNPKDNIAFARKLYDQSGKQPWKASEKCWK
jgi:hypothetical protein